MNNYKPLTIVVFGATGDLFKRKLSEALFDLYNEEILPVQTTIYGYSRKDFSDKDFRDFVLKNIPGKNEEKVNAFLKNVFYRQGDIENIETYNELKKELSLRDEQMGECSNKLFYLAVVPELYERVFRNLSVSGLTIPCGSDSSGDKDTWIRILVEKPFGKNQLHAEMLDELLGKLFYEDQVFRIDHYLAKETLQNILAFRFANSLFEPLWSRKHIEKVEIKAYEKSDIQGRGAFYDPLGALKDVGQNHLLQMLSLVSMETPHSLSADSIRRSRSELLSVVNVSKDSSNFIRGQYEDYLLEKGVNNFSETETYFKVELEILNERWKGVPFYIEHGKALSETISEIVVTFKDEGGSSDLFPNIKNTLVFHIQPREAISVDFFAKKSGFGYELEKKTLSFEYKSADSSPFVYPYKKLLVDALKGDQTLFVSTSEICHEWRIVGDIMKKLEEKPLLVYPKGSEVIDIKI